MQQNRLLIVRLPALQGAREERPRIANHPIMLQTNVTQCSGAAESLLRFAAFYPITFTSKLNTLHVNGIVTC